LDPSAQGQGDLVAKTGVAQGEVPVRRLADRIHQPRLQFITEQLPIGLLSCLGVSPQCQVQRMRCQWYSGCGVSSALASP